MGVRQLCTCPLAFIVKLGQLLLEFGDACTVLLLQCLASARQTAAAQAQAGVDEPVTPLVADQRRTAANGLLTRVDDRHFARVLDGHLEPALAHRRIKALFFSVEVAIDAVATIGRCELFGWSDLELIQGFCQVQGRIGCHCLAMLHRRGLADDVG
ncbi:hypothetical protein D3C79_879570 [compost metagenome]